MAGIFGIFHLDKSQVGLREIKNCLNKISHRGRTIHQQIDGNIGIGYVGNPDELNPYVSNDTSIIVAINGKIFNKYALQRELKKEGLICKTNIAAEVIAKLYRIYGNDFVLKLNGNFAIAIWDTKKQELSLFRDRFGVVPLYWGQVNNTFIFSSEIKAIIAHSQFSVDINYDALNEYFTFQNLFRYHTIFKNVNMMPAATIRSISNKKPQLSQYTYWDYDFTNRDLNMTEEEAKEETKRLLKQAVGRQLIDDENIGIMLSGGMDSGSILAMASEERKRLSTFTIGFHMDSVEGFEANYDERAAAELMANYFKTAHYEQIINSGDMNWVMPKIIYHLEDLRVGMCYANYYVANLASKFVDIVLNGSGGDELFGGYGWRYFRIFDSTGRENFIKKYYEFWQRLVNDTEKRSLFTKNTWDKVEHKDTFEIFRRVLTFNEDLKYNKPEDHIANAMYFEIKTFLPALFIVENKLTAAHGLEERVCFMDNDLVNFAQKIPIRYKIKDIEKIVKLNENEVNKFKQYNDYDRGKNVLKKAMKEIIPHEIIEREKQGFSSPDQSWYRKENAKYIKDTLLNKNAAYRDIINQKYVEKILKEHDQGVNYRLLIWSLLSFEWWCRIYLNNKKIYE